MPTLRRIALGILAIFAAASVWRFESAALAPTNHSHEFGGGERLFAYLASFTAALIVGIVGWLFIRRGERDRRSDFPGLCEHCNQSFLYRLYHSGFSDCSYAYCDKCGMTAVLSYWSKGTPRRPSACPPHQEICAEFEKYLEPCSCGGAFKKGSSPRCPHCSLPLSAQLATRYIEANAPGTRKGWRWQRNWNQLYCIVIGNREVHDNFKPNSGSPSSLQSAVPTPPPGTSQ